MPSKQLETTPVGTGGVVSMMMPELRFDRQMSKSHDKIALMEEKKISRLLVQAPDDSDKPKSSGGAPGSNTNADTS